MNCPHCNEALSERGVFCKACAAQAKCMKCRELLEPAATACVECGTKVGQTGEGPDSISSLVASETQPNRNILSYAETRNSRTFHASLSDNAMQVAGNILGDFFVQRGATRTSPQDRPPLKQDLALHPAPAGVLPPVNGNNQPAAENLPAAAPNEEKERVLKLFLAEGEALALKDNRLKAKSQSDFLRRLTYLFLYAHELHGRQFTTYDDLRSILQVAKVWDSNGNARTWLGKRVGFTADNENRLRLTAPGREDAIKTLNEALDPNTQDTWNPDKKIPRKIGPRKKA